MILTKKQIGALNEAARPLLEFLRDYHPHCAVTVEPDRVTMTEVLASTPVSEAVEEIKILRTALADAIRRPMGVIPTSAEGHITDDEIRRAEDHRTKFRPDGERVCASGSNLSKEQLDSINWIARRRKWRAED